MISSISFDSSISFPMPSLDRSEPTLSLEQQELIDETLSFYSANNLNPQDAKEIVEAFSNAGIQPSKELANAMDSYGFDAKEVGVLAGLAPVTESMPSSSSSMNMQDQDRVVEVLESLFDDKNSNEASKNFESIEDYTSRILRLNEETQESVLNLFDQYSQENTSLQPQEAKDVMSRVLTELLKDSNNYQTTSFYA